MKIMMQFFLLTVKRNYLKNNSPTLKIRYLNVLIFHLLFLIIDQMKKLKVASVIKKKIEKLTNDEYAIQFGK